MRDSARIDVTATNGVMEEHGMTSGVIPLRHASLPGHVKLPRRYEKAAMGTKGIPVRVRKISLQPGQSVLGDSLSERMDDLMAAVLWVKQELIMLRQHDILLKRQFFDIQHSIHSLQKPKPSPSSPSAPPTTSPTHSPIKTPTPASLPSNPHSTTITTTDNDSDVLLNGDVLLQDLDQTHRKKSGRVRDADYVFGEEDYVLETFVVRPSSSVTLLKEDSEEEEGEETDTFCEDLFFRPRTSSMRTSRDMAALARRRGSKELI